MSYFSNPEFFDEMFRELLAALVASQKVSRSAGDELLDLMRTDGGPGAPFVILVSWLIRDDITLSDEEYRLARTLSDSFYVDELAPYDEAQKQAS